MQFIIINTECNLNPDNTSLWTGTTRASPSLVFHRGYFLWILFSSTLSPPLNVHKFLDLATSEEFIYLIGSGLQSKFLSPELQPEYAL